MFFQVDTTICNKDEICVLECPARILTMNADGPVMVKGGEEFCIRCGHCVAVCPVGAVALEFLSPDECLQIEDGYFSDAQQAEMFLRSRRSIRTYRQQPLDKNTLEKALKIASSAPTGSNRQLVKWLVLYERSDVENVVTHVVDWMRYTLANDPDMAAQLNMQKILNDVEQGADRICRQAPHLVFAYIDKEVGVGAADCHTALSYLELSLPSLGGGSCWAGYVMRAVSQWPPLVQFLGLSEEFCLYGAVMVGIPKFHYHRIPSRNMPDITYR